MTRAMRLKSLAYVVVSSLAFSACDSWKWPWGKSDANQAAPETKAPLALDWKGQPIATDTFIRISQIADAGIVNIGSTQIVKRGKSFRGSPFEDFFGDDLFRHFFGEGPSEEPEVKRPSLGSGFILSEDGLIVTNNHVVEKASEITVTIGKDHEYKAKIVGTDPKSDVALIKINPKEKLQPLQLGDSDALQVGEIVVAIGNPFGLSHTVTQGIVSAKERTIGAGPYDNFIQTDASINPGNSGGPLLNLEAKVVGINTAIYANGQGIGFAIPINTAKNIVRQLQEKGTVTRGWLGVYIQKLDPDLAQSLRLPDKKGALVADVQKGSPAERAGLKRGDVILEVDKKTIADSNELPKYISDLPVGKKITLTVFRAGKKIRLNATVGELKNADEDTEPRSNDDEPRDEKTFDKLGFMVQPPREGKGVRIVNIDPSSPAADKGIARGDLILEINRKEIDGVDAYDNLLKSLKKGDSVMLLLENAEAGSRFIAFTL